MAKPITAERKGGILKYTMDQHSEYMKMMDFIRLRWRHLFNDKIQYKTNMFRSFILGMWKVESMPMADACLMLPELRSANTQREYIYKLYDNEIITSNVYVGTDKSRRDREGSYGRGRSSPLVWLSDDTRKKVDLYLDEAVDEILKMARDVMVPSEGPIRKSVKFGTR